MNYNSQILGKIVMELRTEKGYSQHTLAKMAGVPQSTLCEFENGISNFNIEKLGLIAEALEIPLDNLLKDFLLKYSDDDNNTAYSKTKFKEFLYTLNERELLLISDFLKDYLKCKLTSEINK